MWRCKCSRRQRRVLVAQRLGRTRAPHRSFAESKKFQNTLQGQKESSTVGYAERREASCTRRPHYMVFCSFRDEPRSVWEETFTRFHVASCAVPASRTWLHPLRRPSPCCFFWPPSFAQALEMEAAKEQEKAVTEALGELTAEQIAANRAKLLKAGGMKKGKKEKAPEEEQVTELGGLLAPQVRRRSSGLACRPALMRWERHACREMLSMLSWLFSPRPPHIFAVRATSLVDPAWHTSLCRVPKRKGRRRETGMAAQHQERKRSLTSPRMRGVTALLFSRRPAARLPRCAAKPS